jgi:hypothetical protein
MKNLDKITLIALILFTIVGAAIAQQNPFSSDDYNKDPGGTIAANPEFAFTDPKYRDRSMNYIIENPSILETKPKVFPAFVRARNDELSSEKSSLDSKGPLQAPRFNQFRDEKFRESFTKSLENNKQNINALNDAPLVMKDWAKETYDIDMNGKIETFGGNSLTTIGNPSRYSTTFNPQDFPGSIILESGELIIKDKDTLVEHATVFGRKLSLSGDVVNVGGGDAKVSLLSGKKFHVLGGRLDYLNKRYASRDERSFDFQRNLDNIEVSGAFLEYDIKDGQEVLFASADGTFAFDQGTVSIFSPEAESSYEVYDPKDPSRSFLLKCSNACVSEGDPTILPPNTILRHNNKELTVSNEVNGFKSKVVGANFNPKVTVVGGPAAAVVVSPLAIALSLGSSAIGLPFKLIGEAIEFVTREHETSIAKKN